MNPIFDSAGIQIYCGSCLDILPQLPAQSVQTCVTSPPYFGLRDYGCDGQIGLELTPNEFVATLVQVFREVHRVLRDDGTLWLNLGDSYNNTDKWGGGQNIGKHTVASDGAVPSFQVREKRPKMDGLKPKDLIGIPWRVAFALQADGWYLRSDIVWSKPNPMPESVTDRPTKAHEYIFLLTKSQKYFYDADAVRETSEWNRENNPEWQHQRAETNARKGVGNRNAASGGFTKWDASQGRNKRTVWEVATQSCKEAHFATFPPKLIEPCILAGSRAGDTTLDPFSGAGTTALVSHRLGRKSIGCELNPDYIGIAAKRIGNPLFGGEAFVAPEETAQSQIPLTL